MRIIEIKVTTVNVPFVAPIRWSGGANEDWTRLVIEMRTDDGLVGLGETLGGSVTKALIDTEIAPMFLGENPFDLERMISKATFVPLYYGKCGYCAIAGLELACWDLMGKATELPVCRLLGGRLREEIPFAAYVYHRNANRSGEGRVDTLEEVVARAQELVRMHGFGTIKYKGGVKSAAEEIDILRALRSAFPSAKLRYDPQAIYSPATAIRIGKAIEPLDLEYYEDPCWGNVGMARVRERVAIPLASNMATIDLDSAAEGVTLGSVDVILGDIFEWGGITSILKLRGACEMFQINLNYHSAAELGIATAAYLHLAASAQALPHALDTHITELGLDIVKPGVIGLTDRGTMRVPEGPGLGVELDPDKFVAAAEAYARQGDRSVYAEDTARQGVIPVKSML
ncbi:MAG TPA: enolase C-terminal domain-like protein [Alphaproteobacteria bacterium]|nr:enolase C-terminal domain-like protein [Alphaproteobacteria bacterium]